MRPKLKKLREQVMVITGASSGIGLVTAKRAAHEGAKVVLAARNEDALRQAVDEIHAAGGQAAYAVADVRLFDDTRKIAQTAIQAFGGFDTWVNNAGVSMYGRLIDVPLEDERKLFETTYWGVVHGSRVAVEHLRHRGGVLINVGSVLSERAIPLQGTYCAAKHAVKGYTEALRMELEKDGIPIWVTLIKPSAIDTPYRQHASNYLGEEPKNPPPVYAPETVAHVILFCAEHARRDVTVGGAGKAITALGTYMPRLTDLVMEQTMFGAQKAGRPEEQLPKGLHEPGEGGQVRGGYRGHVMRHSLYTAAALHPVATAAIALGAGVLFAALFAALRRREHSQDAFTDTPPGQPVSDEGYEYAEEF